MFKTILNQISKRAYFALLLIATLIACNDDDSISMGISPSEIGGGWEACTRTIYVTANYSSWDLFIPDSVDWLTADPMGGSTLVGYNVTLFFSENKDTLTRYTEVCAYSRDDDWDTVDSISVYQAGRDLEMIFNPIDSIYSAGGGTYSVEIDSNLPWEMEYDCSWMTITEMPLADSTSSIAYFTKRKLQIEIEANDGLNFRRTYVTFSNTNPNSSEWAYTRTLTQIGNGTLETDTQALIELYNATDGDNWTNSWDINSSVYSWSGVDIGMDEHNGDPRIIEVDLDENNLVGEIPESVGHISYLQKLTLSNNSLSGEIPTSFTTLPNLEVLSLNQNQLSGEIPSDIGDWKSMRWLHLNNNQLSGSIPTSITGMTYIEVLTLNDNLLTGDFPEGLEDLDYLQYFYVQNNYLTGSKPDGYDYADYWLQWILTPQLTLE